MILDLCESRGWGLSEWEALDDGEQALLLARHRIQVAEYEKARAAAEARAGGPRGR